MTSKSINTNFLDSFNLDGTPFDKPLEKIKKENQKITESKSLIRKFIIIGMLSHLLHYLIFLPEDSTEAPAQKAYSIPGNYGLINLPAKLTIDLDQEVTKIKILDSSYKRTLAKGFIKKSENLVFKNDRPKYRFYIPYKKFERTLIESNKGIVIAPFKMTNQKKEHYEIKI